MVRVILIFWLANEVHHGYRSWAQRQLMLVADIHNVHLMLVLQVSKIQELWDHSSLLQSIGGLAVSCRVESYRGPLTEQSLLKLLV